MSKHDSNEMTHDVKLLCGDSSFTVWEAGGGYLEPCFIDIVLVGAYTLLILLFGTWRIYQCVTTPKAHHQHLEWTHTFLLKFVLSLVMVLIPLVSMVVRLFVGSELTVNYLTVSDVIRCVAWLYSMGVLMIEHSRGVGHNWVLPLWWTIAFMVNSTLLQTYIGMEAWGLWEFWVFLPWFTCMFVIALLGLFFNQAPDIEEYRKLLSQPDGAPRDGAPSIAGTGHGGGGGGVGGEKSINTVSPNSNINGGGGFYGSLSATSLVSINSSTSAVIQGASVGSDARGGANNARNPYDVANIFSKFTFWWLNPLVVLGYARPLVAEDLYPLCESDRSNHVAAKFQLHWKAELASDNPSLSRAIRKTFMWYTLISWFSKFLSDVMTFTSPLLLYLVVDYVQYSDGPLWQGLVLAALLLITSLAGSQFMQQYWFFSFRIGMRVRAVLVTAVYEKALRLNGAARQRQTVGEIVNHMSIDSQRLMDLWPQLNVLWSAPLQIIVSLIGLAWLLRLSVVGGVAVIVLMLPINAVVIMRMRTLQKEMMSNKDGRIKIMNELLNGIRVVKFFAWEDSFLKKVGVARDRELKTLRFSAFFFATIMVLWMVTPLAVSIATFGLYAALGHTLTPEVAFTALSLFSILRFPLNMLPAAISAAVEAKVSVSRLEGFLLDQELDEDAVLRHPADECNDGVSLRVAGASFTWDKTPPAAAGEDDKSKSADKKGDNENSGLIPNDSLKGSDGVVTEEDEPLLKDVNIEATTGSLVALCGPVGCGKSTLLCGMLGEAKKTKGVVELYGKVAYVSQESWIQNSTLRDNILFGLPFDQVKYDAVVAACQLIPDVAMLPAGDMTEIGEKGINLSGGQKQRVSLARATYAEADIYIMDDPLSAVDAHVGKAIFEECITGVLRGKTRILATHQLQFLPHVDQIVVFNGEGILTEQGTYDALMRQGLEFSKLIDTHVYRHKDNDGDGDSDDGESDNEDDGVVSLEPNKVVFTPEARRQKRKSLTKSSSSVGGDEANDLAVADDPVKAAEAKLIVEEEREVGRVRGAVYSKYMYACGGVFVVTVLLLLFTIDQALLVANNYWLALWSDADTQFTTSQYIMVYAILGGVDAIVVLGRGIVSAFMGVTASKTLQQDLLKRIIRAPMSFFDTTPLGRVLNRFSKDMYVIDEDLPRSFGFYLTMLFTVIGIIVIIIIVTPIFLIMCLPLAWIYNYVQNYYLETSREIKRLDSISRSPIYAHFTETLHGTATIRAYGAEERFTKDNEVKLDLNQRAYFMRTSVNRWLGVRVELIGGIVVFAAALFAVLERNTVNPGAVGLSLVYAMQLTQVLNMLVRMSTELENSMVSVERVEQYSEVEQEAPRHIRGTRPPKTWPSHGAIKFERLTMRYRDGLDLVLRGVTADIQPKEKIGVVGRTGAGKSSLMLALFRMMEATEGRIVIDGVDIRTIGLDDLRSKLGIIPQDPVLFAGTLRSNLDPFDERKDGDIWNVLERVQLKTMATRLPGGLDAPVAEYGSNLSVGQRQLMCLARALLRQAPILVLDEATAAVDYETDSVIQEAIRTEFKNVTVLTIAHRVHTIMDYDRVMVLEKGRIVEFDSPRVLMKNENGVFYSMVKQSGTVSSRDDDGSGQEGGDVSRE
eukprot:TRINITY_DN3793_c1_g3_i1.p1 TRINITY_DN3793_c1_g3~~TRINITY_DN3793_c1_g3_i1.p1  ORF type:complete len:1624 (-),score=345.41 TRINITY_DN3793_c1_g3_i1:937-5808(-)